jgi:hypothetical protein
MSDKMGAKAGDAVFVLGQGSGKVTKELPGGGFAAAVAGRGEQFYTDAGCVGASRDRRVYWHDPIILDPPKDAALWESWKRVALALYDEMAKALGPR